MTDHELEQRLRAWYRADVGDREARIARGFAARQLGYASEREWSCIVEESRISHWS